MMFEKLFLKDIHHKEALYYNHSNNNNNSNNMKPIIILKQALYHVLISQQTFKLFHNRLHASLWWFQLINNSKIHNNSVKSSKNFRNLKIQSKCLNNLVQDKVLSIKVMYSFKERTRKKHWGWLRLIIIIFRLRYGMINYGQLMMAHFLKWVLQII